MGVGVKVQVWGEYALFSRPEMKVERVSYDMLTPSAARGIIEAIYWKPAIKWTIDKIHVINPIKFTNIRRNEVSEVAKMGSIKKAMEKGLTSGRGPTGVAAAALYIASVLLGERKTQRDVADIAGVTEVTIRNRYKALTEQLEMGVTL